MRIQRLGLLLLAVFISACGVSSPPRDFTDVDLLIYRSVMPDNWSRLEVSSKWLENEGQESGAYISFYATNTTFLDRGESMSIDIKMIPELRGTINDLKETT